MRRWERRGGGKDLPEDEGMEEMRSDGDGRGSKVGEGGGTEGERNGSEEK